MIDCKSKGASRRANPRRGRGRRRGRRGSAAIDVAWAAAGATPETPRSRDCNRARLANVDPATRLAAIRSGCIRCCTCAAQATSIGRDVRDVPAVVPARVGGFARLVRLPSTCSRLMSLVRVELPSGSHLSFALMQLNFRDPRRAAAPVASVVQSSTSAWDAAGRWGQSHLSRASDRASLRRRRPPESAAPASALAPASVVSAASLLLVLLCCCSTSYTAQSGATSIKAAIETSLRASVLATRRGGRRSDGRRGEICESRRSMQSPSWVKRAAHARRGFATGEGSGFELGAN